MDVVNDLSGDLAIAVFVDGRLANRLGAKNAKSFIAMIEEELERISSASSLVIPSEQAAPLQIDVSH